MKTRSRQLRLDPERRKPDRNRPHDQNQAGDDEGAAPPELQDAVAPNARGEQHEQEADEQHRELILEFAQVAQTAGAEVADGDAADGHRHDAAVRHQAVASEEDEDDPGKRQDVLVRLRHDRAEPQEPGQDESAEYPRSEAEPEARHHIAQSARDRVGPRHEHDLEDENREDHADRIDQHALGLENRLGPRTQAHLAEQRRDDRGSGDDHQAAEKGRLRP